MPEDRNEGEEELCGKLNYSMYGTRDAAQNWENEYAMSLVNIGFNKGKASPCLFYHAERKIRTFIHGDEYVSAGDRKGLLWLSTQLEAKYEIKTTMVSQEEKDQKTVRVLNRLVTLRANGDIEYEADPRHAERLIEELTKKDNLKAVVTPFLKAAKETDLVKPKEAARLKIEGKTKGEKE